MTVVPEVVSVWGSSSKSPADDYSGVHKGPGFKKYMDENRAHCMARHDALLSMASHMEKLIEKQGKWWLRNLDAKYTARKITKPIRHAAALEEEAARALGSSYQLYLNSFGTPKQVKPSDFDPTM